MTKLVTVPEAICVLCVGQTTFYMLKKLHPLAFPKPCGAVNRHYLYDLDELRAFITMYASHNTRRAVVVACAAKNAEVKHG